ncbi:MAG: fibronectin type III domain-containing protein [Acutalibacteraceae bacterium]
MKKILPALLCALFVFSACTFFSSAESEPHTAESTVTEPEEIIIDKVNSIRVQSADSQSITLQWNAVGNADGYKVYFKADNAKKYTSAGTVITPSVVIDSLTSGSVYSFRIKAFRYNEKQKPEYGDLSDEFKTVTAPKKVKNIVTSTISDSSITLSWSASAGATHYEISYFSREENKFIVHAVVSGQTSFEVAGLSPASVYTFRIRAVKVFENQEAFSVYSDDYSEFTDKNGTPYTKAQIARRYNSIINTLKEKKSLKAEYSKTVSTYVLDCSYDSLTSTCKNIMNLFDGKMKKSLTFQNGSADGYTVNSFIEPYDQKARLKGNDILSFSYQKTKDGTEYSIKLKSESAGYKNKTTEKPKSNKTVADTVKLETLKITPLKIKSATQIYDGVQINLTLSSDQKKQTLTLTNPVLVSADCKVSTVSFKVNTMYEINEKYVFGL